MNIVLTGGTSGIGWETLKALLPSCNQVFLPVRNRKKAENLIKHLSQRNKIRLIDMDLSLMSEVKKGADQILRQCDQIHLLINNAGGMYPAGKKTIEGIDLTFATNHLGHFLLTKELLPALINAKGRVISVSSEAHRIATNPREDFGLENKTNTGLAYGKVKLYAILFTKELKKRVEDVGVTAFSLHPGAVKTAFGSDASYFAKIIITISKLFFISAKEGSRTTVFLAKTPLSKLNNGSYYVRKNRKKPAQLARNEKLGAELWEYCEQVLNTIKLA